jgi:WG containing repeat
MKYLASNVLCGIVIRFLALVGGFYPEYTLSVFHDFQQGQSTQLYPISKVGKYGYVDQSGTVVIPLNYAWASDFSGELAVIAVSVKNDPKSLKFGYINKSGTIVIKPGFDFAADFFEGMAIVGQADPEKKGRLLYGFIDPSGKVIIEPQYYKADVFSEGLALVADDKNNFGYIDNTGKIVIAPQFYKAGRFSEELAPATDSTGKNSGYINKKGRFIIKPQFSFGTSFSEGLAAVATTDNKVGYINREGNFVIPPKYVAGYPFSEGLAAVRDGQGWVYIEKNGGIAFNKKFQKALSFSEGLGAVKVDDEWGYISRMGDFAIAPQFASAKPFYLKQALVLDEIYLQRRYINQEGQVIVKLPSLNAPPPIVPLDFTDVAGLGFGGDDGGGWELVPILLDSTPKDAEVYLVPKRLWEKQPNPINNDEFLSKYRFEGGNTPAQTSVSQKVYWAVFITNGKRIPLRVDVIKGKENTYKVVFSAQ